MNYQSINTDSPFGLKTKKKFFSQKKNKKFSSVLVCACARVFSHGRSIYTHCPVIIRNQIKIIKRKAEDTETAREEGTSTI